MSFLARAPWTAMGPRAGGVLLEGADLGCGFVWRLVKDCLHRFNNPIIGLRNSKKNLIVTKISFNLFWGSRSGPNRFLSKNPSRTWGQNWILMKFRFFRFFVFLNLPWVFNPGGAKLQQIRKIDFWQIFDTRKDFWQIFDTKKIFNRSSTDFQQIFNRFLTVKTQIFNRFSTDFWLSKICWKSR